MLHRYLTNNVAKNNPIFKLFSNNFSNGIDNLDPNLTINGTTVSPLLRYRAKDATDSEWPAWGYGDTLYVTASSGVPHTIHSDSPFYGPSDDSVRFRTGSYYGAADFSFGGLGLDDFVIEAVLSTKHNTIAQERPLGKDGTTSLAVIQQLAGGFFAFSIADESSNTLNVFSSLAYPNPGAFLHLFVACNRDENSSGGCYFFINGTRVGLGNPSAVGDLSLANYQFTIGGKPLASDAYISYVSWWKYTNWFAAGATGTSHWAPVAIERFSKLIGLHANAFSKSPTPLTASRSCVAYADKYSSSGNRSYWNTLHDMPRIVSRMDNSGKLVRGYLSEGAVDNRIAASIAFSSGAWSKSDVQISSSAAVAPNFLTEASYMVANSGTVAPSINNLSVPAALGEYVIFSVFAKPNTTQFIRLANTVTTPYSATFNVLTASVSNVSSEVQASIENWGDGWHRCWMKYPAPDTTISAQITVGKDEDVGSFSSESENCALIWGAQVETAVSSSNPSSFIRTTGSIFTRAKDILIYSATFKAEVVSSGTFEANAMFSVGSSQAIHTIFSIHHGSEANKIDLISLSGANNLAYTLVSGSSYETSITGSESLSDNNNYFVRTTWSSGSSALYVNGTQEEKDVDVNPPSNYTKINIGSNLSSGNHLNGVISNVKIYKRPIRI